MSFIKLPKDLFFDDRYKDLSLSAKVLYAFLLDRASLSQKNNLVDKNGRVFIYFTRQEACEVLGFSIKKAVSCFKELESKGLIFQKFQGLTKPNLIYVNFDNSGVVKTTTQEWSKLQTTNTDINNTEISQTAEDGKLLFKILENCELEIWNDGTGEMLKNVITELFYLPYVYVGGARLSNAVVRSKLTGLSADALIRVVDMLRGKDVKNVHAYLLSAVVNAADDYAADLIISS